MVTTAEPLRGSDVPGDKANIQYILARCEPRRVRHGRRSIWVEEFLVQWGPENCTFGDALEQCSIGFDIVSITTLEATSSSQDILPFAACKRPTREHRRDRIYPPLSTSCIVEFAPPPQRPLHILSIVGSTQALDKLLARETLPPPALPISAGTPLNYTPSKLSSLTQAPTRTKLWATAPPPLL